MTPQPWSPPIVLAEREVPFWGFGEIFASAASFFVALNVLAAIGEHFLGRAAKLGTWAVAEEFGAYLAMFALLKILFVWQGHPLLHSLAWLKTSFELTPLVLCGLILFGIGVVLQLVLGMPDSAQTPFEKMLVSDRFSLIAISLFGVTIGPIVEELLFRGLLQPVAIYAAGVFPGILITSAIFAAMHLPQNGGVWQIADVYLNGTISELATRRAEFAGILRSQGINGLIGTLNAKADQLVLARAG